MTSIGTDPLLDAIAERLSTRFRCHTAILYGSRARGDATADSDYDVIAFRDEEKPLLRESGMWRGAILDIFLYPTSALTTAGADLMHVQGGIVLFQRDGMGDALLRRLDETVCGPPKPLAEDEIAARKVWAWKMLARASRDNSEAHYRRACLLVSQLEDHYLLKGERYLGPKRAFEDLKKSDIGTYWLFKRALQPGASMDAIAALVRHIYGPRPSEMVVIHD